MATAGTVPPNSARPGTGLKMSLPVIEHPRARMGGDMADLAVRGESRLGGNISRRSDSNLSYMSGMSNLSLGGRMKTFVSVDKGQLYTGLDRGNLPPLSWSSPGERIVRVGSRCNPGDITVRNLGDKGKFRREISEAKTLDEDEIYHMVQEKLTTGYHGLKHMFKSSDPNGQGNVTREALLKILYSLVGHFPIEKYNKFMVGLCLSGYASISFDLFVSRFQTNETVSKEWMSPVQKKDLHVALKNQHPEEHLRYTEYSTHNGYISGAYCHAKLRDGARARAFSLPDLLPGSCSEPGGMVVAPQLKAAIDQVGFKISAQEFGKLWTRYDFHGAGAIRTGHLYRCLGLDDYGNPRPMTTPRNVPVEKKENTPKTPNRPPPPARSKTEPKTFLPPLPTSGGVMQGSSQDGQEGAAEENVEGREEKEKRKTTSRKLARKVPRLERIVDCLALKFEEPYHNLLMGMQCFDFLADGMVSKIDLKRVLAEFGLNVGAIEFDNFLARSNIRSIRGNVPYKEFLIKYWNRSETGLVNRIVTNSFHLFNSDKAISSDGLLTAEELEARIIEFIHGDFLRLLGALRKMDKYSIGVVTQHEFKFAVEKTLGYNMNDKQWEELKEQVGLDPDGLVPFPKFLEKFSTQPGSWNRKDLHGFQVVQTNYGDAASVVDRLQQEAEREQRERKKKDEAEARDKEDEERRRDERRRELEKHDNESSDAGRPLRVLNETIQHVFKTNFHAVDTAFKLLDRRITGRFAKHQLADLLKEGGIELSRDEVDRLWDTFPLGTDGMFNFTTLVRHFTDYGKVPDRVPTAVEPAPPPPPGDFVIRYDRDERPYHGKFSYAYQNVPTVNEPHAPVKIIPKNVENKMKENETKEKTTKFEEDPMERIAPQVNSRWEKLKAIFRHLDKAGHAKILAADMKDIIHHMRFSVTSEEADKLIAKFDKNRDGSFHYIDFLKSFSSEKSGNDSAFNKYTFRMEQKLIKDHKSIRRAFKKADTSGTGYMTVAEFKKVLKSCNISLNAEDLYHLMTEFDSNMNGRISYPEFLNTVLSTV